LILILQLFVFSRDRILTVTLMTQCCVRLSVVCLLRMYCG